MRKCLRYLAVLVLLAAGHAHATFHLWAMQELYSNADGSVQFLELRALSGGQQFMADHVLSTSSGGVTRSFVFPAGLPGDSSNKTMLIGTQGFAALGVVTPDYVVPNGFFFQGGGTISFAEGADLWTHGALPGGSASLNRNGSTGTNSPTNFAGQTGSVSSAGPTTKFNVQALWWADPDESESGWGLNVAHQSDLLFTSWFTYDTDGSGMWLYMSSAPMTSTNRYEGDIYRATGSSFNAYDASRFTQVAVGRGVINFTDAEHGTFNYTVNGITQTKAIKRFIFASPVPTCSQGGSHGANPNYTDLWRGTDAAAEVGWGVNIVHQGDTLFISWFTYGSDGRGLWMYAAVPRNGTTSYFGTLQRNTRGPAFNSTPWNRSLIETAAVGSVTLNFSDASNATFTYTVDGITQSKFITRNIFQPAVTICR
jgi:hypothetical protein